jgi:hypothetical protein
MKLAGAISLLPLTLLLTVLVACRSNMIDIKLTNSSSQPVSTIIVDYPSATFGKDRLAPGETFVSKVKITDTGTIKVQFTDAKGSFHTVTGPMLRPDEVDPVGINFDQNTATVSRGGLITQ